MVGKRTLPERRNPLLVPDVAPSHEDLVARRRLGQTNLAVKPGIAGAAKASKAENLGTFDYAHLRVPLPKDLTGSGIFTLKTSTAFPESYFLMRRSSDGYISATGMFKAAFPWSSLHEEETERRFQKSFQSAGNDEVAGSVWIAPEEALRLSEEYGMRHWIVALLDPSPIEPGHKDKEKKRIQMPPRFDVDKAIPPVVLSHPSLRTTRARSSRSASPSKIATPSRKIATPRKPRATRSSVKPEAMNGDEVTQVSQVTQKSSEEVEVTADGVEVTQESSIEQTEVIENGAPVPDSVASVASPAKQADTVRIEVQETVEQHGDVETTTTNVKIDVPADHPELPTPEDPTEMIENAKKMVEAARAQETGATSSSKTKRKVEEVEEDEEEVAARPAKQARVYTAEQKYQKEKMTTRALLGIGVMAAIGTAFQYFA